MTTRRKFVELSAATVVAAGIGQPTRSVETKGGMPYRTLGRTGARVSMVGIGGYHLGKPERDAQESIRIVRMALDEGVNFLDNCLDYNGGESRIRIGKAPPAGYRPQAFLMTTIYGRTKLAAYRQIPCAL